MIVNDKEIENIIYLRDYCKGPNKDACVNCPFYEGYCHLVHYLLTQKEEENK